MQTIFDGITIGRTYVAEYRSVVHACNSTFGAVMSLESRAPKDECGCCMAAASRPKPILLGSGGRKEETIRPAVAIFRTSGTHIGLLLFDN